MASAVDSLDIGRLKADLATLKRNFANLQDALQQDRQIVLTPRGQYASALKSAVRAQYAGSVQPVPAAAANMAAFRNARLSVAHEEEHGGQYHGQGGLPSAASSMMIAAHRLPNEAVVRGKLAHITPRLPAVGHAPSRPQDEEEQAPKPAPVAKYVVSGGLTGFSVANDIHFIDFDAVDPKTPYAESKAIPWNMEINPDVGGYGPYNADSAILTEHLERLRHQQAVVLEMIAAQHQNPEHHSHPLADLAGPLGKHAFAPQPAGLMMPEAVRNPRRRTSADVAHLPPPMPRRVSHAGSVVAVPAAEGLGFGGVRPQFRAQVAADIARQMPPPPPPSLRPKHFSSEAPTLQTEMPTWREPVTERDIAANLKFMAIKPKKPELRRKSHVYSRGLITFACWLAAAIFYLYVRIGRTMNSHSNVFGYQVVVLIAEILVGLATLRQGFSLVRRLDAAPAVTPAQLQRMVSSGKVQAPRKTLSVKQLAEQVAAAPPASAPDSFETPVANPVPERIPGTGSDAATTQGEGLRPGTPPQVAPGERALTDLEDAPEHVAVNIRAATKDEGPVHFGMTIGPLRAAAAALKRSGSSDIRANHGGGEIVASLIADSSTPPSDVHQTPYHIQVLVSGCTPDLAQTEAALKSVMDAALPPGCTISVHLVDPLRDEGREAFVASLRYGAAMSYSPAMQRATAEVEDWGPAATLNRVLWQIYPEANLAEGENIVDTELVALLRADQSLAPDFFLRTLPALELADVRLAQGRLVYPQLPPAADVFDVTRVMFGEAAVPGNEACGCAYAADSGFVIRADALRTVRWLPEHSEAIGHALGKELPRCGFLSCTVDTATVLSAAPRGVHAAFAVATAQSRGLLQSLWHGHINNGLPSLPRRRQILYNNAAWQQVVAAVTQPLWVGIPIIQVLAAIFPWRVEGWFGIGFFVYYLLATPLLFQAYSLRRMLALWHAYTAAQALGWARLRAAASALVLGRIPERGTEKWPAQPAESVAPAEAAAEPVPQEVVPGQQPDGDPRSRWWRPFRKQPNPGAPRTFDNEGPALADANATQTAAAAPLLATAAAAAPAAEAEQAAMAPAVTGGDAAQPTAEDAAAAKGATAVKPAPAQHGLTMEFAAPRTNAAHIETVPPPLGGAPGGVLGCVPWSAALTWAVSGMAVGMGVWLLFATGSPRHVDSVVLAANLPLILSIFWALFNHLSAAPALAYAIGVRRGPLAALSASLMVVCYLSALLVAIAAIGLGNDVGSNYANGGPARRLGFIQAQGASIPGTPSE